MKKRKDKKKKNFMRLNIHGWQRGKKKKFIFFIFLLLQKKQKNKTFLI